MHASFKCKQGQTAVLDRGYQAHRLFDQWQEDGCHFVCRIKEKNHKEILCVHPLPENSNVFFDAEVILGTPGINQTKKPVRLVGYTIDDKDYWVATDRFDLTAENVALVYKATLKNGLFTQSLRCVRKFYPRNIMYMPPVKFPDTPRP